MTEKPYRERLYSMPDKRIRRTKSDIDTIRGAIAAVVTADPPMTVRQVFYQLVVRGVIDKTEAEYQGTVIRLLTDMRIRGELDWDTIVDESRRARVTQTFDSVTDALNDTARFYRRSALRECPDYIEVWLEKDALAGVVYDVVAQYDVPLMVSRGMPSITFLWGSFNHIAHAARAGKRTTIYQLGDHDPSGGLIPQNLYRRLNEWSVENDIEPPRVIRLALTESQIGEHNLPTRPTKRIGNRHAYRFAGDSVELDAMQPRTLRDLVRQSIEVHIPRQTLAVLRAAEEFERDQLRMFARNFKAD